MKETLVRYDPVTKDGARENSATWPANCRPAMLKGGLPVHSQRLIRDFNSILECHSLVWFPLISSDDQNVRVTGQRVGLTKRGLIVALHNQHIGHRYPLSDFSWTVQNSFAQPLPCGARWPDARKPSQSGRHRLCVPPKRLSS